MALESEGSFSWPRAHIQMWSESDLFSQDLSMEGFNGCLDRHFHFIEDNSKTSVMLSIGTRPDLFVWES